MQCAYCNTELTEAAYRPARSKIGLEICVCSACGLVQGRADFDAYQRINDMHLPAKSVVDHISADADYSEIRVGKQQMAPKAFDILNRNVDVSRFKTVLDMRSARGHFALGALEQFGLDVIDCIEPDEYMNVGYRDNAKIRLHQGSYKSFAASPGSYDLVYSCHTLEHYRSPGEYLDYVRSCMAPDGVFLLDVPDFDTIQAEDNFDDFFYDKHLFYFREQHLGHWLETAGFSIISASKSSGSIEFLLSKRRDADDRKFGSLDGNENARETRQLIDRYALNLTENRAKCQEMVENLYEALGNKKSIAAFGCGRLFDTMLKYGAMDPNRFNFLIDNFLADATPTLYGKPLAKQSILNDLDVDSVIVFTRKKNERLLSDLSALAGKAAVLHIMDFQKSDGHAA